MKKKFKDRLIQTGRGGLAIVWALFGLAVITGLGSVIFSYSYFPFRLYYTGQKSTDIVKSKYISTYISAHSGATINSYYLTGLKNNYTYNVDRGVYKKTESGDTINVFTSNTIKKGMYIGDKKPTIWTVLLFYESDGLLHIAFLLGAVGLIFSAVFFSLKSLMKRINRDVKDELANSKKPLNPAMVYAKSYTSFLTGIAFSYAFSFLIIKGIYQTESLDSMIAGGIIFLGSLILLFTPILLYYTRGYLKGLTHKNISYTLQLISLCLGIYATVKLFMFIHSRSSFANEDITKLIIDFLKSLVP